jgi:hypothetical protein
MGQFSKGLKQSLDSEFSKVLGTVSPEGGTDVMMQHNEFKREIPETIIKKKYKKSEIQDLVGKKTMNLPIGKLTSIGKTETKETKLIVTKEEIEEKWSQKYKDSIDCKNPKGFSQRAHCQGKNKKSETKEAMGAANAGGFVGKVAFNPESEFVKKSFKETPKLDKGEFKEATGASSAGGYLTTSAFAKSTSKKDWRGKSKTLFPGGQFVQVKKKCKKFPYCNQGDIKALNLTNEQVVENIVTELSEKYNLSKKTIKNMIIREYINTNQ